MMITSHVDNWRDAVVEADLLIADLRSELRQTQALLEGARKDLSDAKREHAMTKAMLASEKSANRRMHDKYPPTGDMKRGYFCGVCGLEVNAPFDWNYCPECGTAIDWRTRNDEIDRDETFSYDLKCDR